MRYHMRKPSAPLSAAVDYLWYLSDVPAHARERILPTGTLELVVNLQDDEFRIYHSAGAGCRRFRGAIVSGCYGAPFGIDTRVHASIIGVHFKPGGAAGLLGVPPGKLADAHVSLEELWGQHASELREGICAAPDLRRRFQILERALLTRLCARSARRTVMAAVSRLDHPGVEIGDITRILGLSRRRFIEIFTEDVGMTPKVYSRVRRFQRALACAMRSPSPVWSHLALECGYFDQAHLCRDWGHFTGLSPSEFVAMRQTRVKENHLALPDAG